MMVSIANTARIAVLFLALMAGSNLSAQTYGTVTHSTSCCGIGIDRVQVGSINNASLYNAGVGYYTYYSGIGTDLDVNTAYTITITRNTYSTTKHAAWIDYNRDGDFDDAGEQIVDVTNPPVTASHNFTVPGSASGGMSRLRVRSTWTAVLTPTNTVSYGDTEDYDINITVPAPKISTEVPAAVYAGGALAGTVSAIDGLPPYSFSINPISNASWINVNALNGDVFGSPPEGLGGTTSSFELIVTDSGSNSDSKMVSLEILSPHALPYTDDMSGAKIANYVVNTSTKAFLDLRAEGGASGLGLVLSSDGTTGWPLSPASVAANAAVLDNPAHWDGGSNPDPTDFNGTAKFFVDAPVVTRLAFNFDYRITNNATAADKEYFTNFVIEYSENGVDWLRASGPNANANGFYRQPTTGFVRENSTLTLSGKQSTVGIRISWLVRNSYTGPLNTFVSIDNLNVFVPVQILNQSVLTPAQETVPYGPIVFDIVGGTAPISVAFDPLKMPNSAMNLAIAKNATSGLWELATPSNMGPGAGMAGLQTFGVIANDANNVPFKATFNVSVSAAPAPLGFENSGLPSTGVGSVYEQTLKGKGGVPFIGANPYRFAIVNSSASWLAMDSLTGVLSGLVPGTDLGITHQITISVTDRIGTVVNYTFPLAVVDALDVSTLQVGDGQVATSYRFKLQVGGGTAPYHWEFVSGSKPIGISLDLEKGELYGTPYIGEEGLHQFMVRVTDSGTQETTATITMMVHAASSSTLTVTSTPSSLPTTNAGVEFDVFLRAAGGFPPYQWDMISNNLPSGMTLSSDGFLRGTPVQGSEGRYILKVRVTDSQSISDIENIVFDINPEYFAPSILTAPILPAATQGVLFAKLLEVSNGLPPYVWSIQSGALPPGITLNTNGGSLTGVPSSNALGLYSFTIQVRDGADNTAQLSANLTVAANPNSSNFQVLTTAADVNPASDTGQHYSTLFNVQGGVAPYTWILQSGALPAGLQFASHGGIFGTPAPNTAGEYSFVVQVTDSIGNVALKTLALTVMETAVNPDAGLGGNTDGLANLPQHAPKSGCALSGTTNLWWLGMLMLLAFAALKVRKQEA